MRQDANLFVTLLSFYYNLLLMIAGSISVRCYQEVYMVLILVRDFSQSQKSKLLPCTVINRAFKVIL